MIMIGVVGELIQSKQKPHQLRRGLVFVVRRVRDLNSRKIVIP